MSSKISWFNKEMCMQIIRNMGWISVVYFLGLVFALPLRILMMHTNDEYTYYQEIINPFSYLFEIQYGLMLIIPVLLAIFLFLYLHLKDPADFLHSLPISRKVLFNHYVGMGAAFLTIPVLLISCSVFILRSILDLGGFISISEILIWTGITWLFTLFIFFCAVFVGMMTGMAILQGILTYILLLFPTGILVLGAFNFKYFLHGFSYEYYLDAKVETYSPIFYGAFFENNLMSIPAAFLYSGLIVVLYFVSLWLYKKRPIEAASSAIAFSAIKPIFIYGAAFCMMLIGGMYFGETQNSTGWLIFGYIAGSLLGYFAAKMMIEKSWRVFGEYKGYLLFAGSVGLLLLLFQFDFTGFEKKVPEFSEIKQVHIGNNVYGYTDGDELGQVRYLKEKENIQNVLALHKALINKDAETGEGNRYYNNMFFFYELENGKKVIRQYKVPEKNSLTHLLKPIYESKEYKELIYPVLDLDETKIDKMAVISNGPVNKSVSITEQKQILESIAALRKDLRSETYEEMTDESQAYSGIELLLNNDAHLYLEWMPGYENFESWLIQNNMLENARVTADDLSEVWIAPRKDIDPSLLQAYSTNEIIKEFKSKNSVLKVEDEQEMEMVLENSKWPRDGEYVVLFVYKNGNNVEVMDFINNKTPEFVKDHFEK
jgi:ABC-2 type transport system permease protein